MPMAGTTQVMLECAGVTISWACSIEQFVGHFVEIARIPLMERRKLDVSTCWKKDETHTDMCVIKKKGTYNTKWDQRPEGKID